MDVPRAESHPTTGYDYDVLVVGGGPGGCSAGVFTARYGLATGIFDRGRSSIRQCAHLGNYLGLPGGIDIDALYGLMHDHAAEAGCDLASDVVESVARADDGGGFAVETQEGRRVTTRRVVAATRYDGEYLRPLDGGRMFESCEHDGEEREQFDRSYAGHDGTTPVAGLYVVSPSEETDRQAIIAAGRAARVGIAVVEDVRREQGYQGAAARHYDWVRREAELEDEWRDRDRWREWFEARLPDDHDLTEERRRELREREIDRRTATCLSDEGIQTRTARGQRRLLKRIDDERVSNEPGRSKPNADHREVSDCLW